MAIFNSYVSLPEGKWHVPQVSAELCFSSRGSLWISQTSALESDRPQICCWVTPNPRFGSTKCGKQWRWPHWPPSRWHCLNSKKKYFISEGPEDTWTVWCQEWIYKISTYIYIVYYIYILFIYIYVLYIYIVYIYIYCIYIYIIIHRIAYLDGLM